MGRGTFRTFEMLRGLRKAVLVLSTLLLVGFGALVLLAKVYESEVKQKLIGALNEQLNTPVSVSGMDLTLVARFPRASMRLSDVLAKEVRSDGAPVDTLLFARELYLEFSLLDLFRGDHTVQEVHAVNVKLYPGLDANGKENYIVWRTDSTSKASSPINLDEVSFNDLTLRYRDDRSALVVHTRSNTLTFRGRFDQQLNQLAVAGDVQLGSWWNGKDLVLADRRAYVRLNMEFGGNDALFRITKGEVRSGSVPLEVTLAVVPTAHGHDLDLRANGLGLDLADVVHLLPADLPVDLRRYALKGEVDLAVRYAGPTSGPSLSVGAKVVKGRLKEQRSGSSFTDVFGELALELTPQGVPRKLVVKNFSAKSGSGSVSGNWQSNGLRDASVKAELRADIALADLLRFAQVDTLEQVGGRLKADLHVNGKLRDMGQVRPKDLRGLTISGTLASRDATLKMKGIRHRIEHLDADLAIHGNDATVQGLQAELQGNRIVLSGTLGNLVPFLLFDDQHLMVEAKGASPRIDLATLISNENSGEGVKDYRLTLPSSIELALQAQVDELVFEEFKATGISASLAMRNKVLRVAPMVFTTANGRVNGGLELDARDTDRSYPLAINATLEGIQLKALFREFQDFGQDFIGHRHLDGRTRAQVAFNAPLSPGMKLDMDRLVCVIDIAVDNGHIKDHAPLLEVADHLQKNKLVAPFVAIPELRKRLGDIHFARLENQIQIRNGAVHVPQMLVSSSVMDIELSGTHWFDDRIDHHLNFRLSDLFRKGQVQDEFGPIVDDGTGMRIFLHMYGTASDPQFGNDGAMAAAKRKRQFQEEKQELKQILREELGLFKGRTSATTSTPQGPGTPLFQVVEPGAEPTPTAEIKPRGRKGLGRLMDEKQEEEQVTFEVE